MSPEVDVVVVGGGIVGVSVAHEILRLQPSSSVLVLEKDDQLAQGQTGSNSGVIHAGVYYQPGSLKAQLCVSGALRMRAYCEAHDLPYRHTGKLIVACEERELPALAELERRATINGVSFTRIEAARIRAVEPAAAGIAALHVHDTAITDFAAVTRSIARDVERAGGVLRQGRAVSAVRYGTDGVVVQHGAERTTARRVVVCAGTQSDRMAEVTGGGPDPRVVPFRGGYLRLRGPLAGSISIPVYPVPDPAFPFLGVHVTPTVDGEVLLGPTSMLWHSRGSGFKGRDVLDTALWPGTWKVLARHPRLAAKELRLFASRRAFHREARRLLPELSGRDVAPARAGIRAQAIGRDGSLVDDFVFDDAPGVTQVRNAPSPAATAAFSIGELLARRVLDRAAT